MTRILKMQMKGFKSFGNRVELEFGSNFNCVLGPNGAGKSNILDALCFVLGKGSAKGLRADKAANLIYNGGKSKEPAKSGEVSIFFDNEKKLFPADDKQIKITRMIKPDGQSVYKINDQRRTRQQVLDLLAIANIDPDGYNIILQGDIVRLVEMSSVERRQIIEDIAGISVYEEKKNKALSELNKVEEKLNEAEIILTERQTYLKELKKDRDQALKYKDLSDRIKSTKATYATIQIRNREEKKAALDRNIKKHEADIQELQKDINRLKAEIEKKKTQIQRLSKEIEEKGEKDQVRIMKDIEQLKIDIATNKTRISSNENEVMRVRQRKDQLQGSLSEIDEKISELNRNKLDYEKKAASVQKQIDVIRARISQFKQKHKIQDSQALEHDMDKLDSEAEEKQKQIQALREEQQSLLRQKDKVELFISTVEDKIAKVAEVAKESRADLEKLKSMKQEFKKTTLELNKLLNEDSSMAAQLGHARDKLVSARDSLSKLQARRTGIQQKLMDSIALRTILDSRNRFGTVHGTISDLGRVSSRFSLALEVAAGARIKSIVVDTDKTAAGCIKHLKSNKLGTATFLPLNKMKRMDKPVEPSVLKSQGVHGLAVQLIDFDARFRAAFEYVFGSTVVVDSIDVARRIGVGSARMVTLDGDLVELSGAMHGGYRQKKHGLGFQEKEVVGEIAEKEKAVAELEGLVSGLEKRRKESEARIIRLRELKANLEGDIIKSERSLHLEEGDIEATRKERQDYQAQLKDAEGRIREVESKISGLVRELTDIKARRQKLRSTIAQMRNPTVLAELNTFEQKQMELKEELIRIESNTKNATMQTVNILLPEKDNTIKILHQHEKEERSFVDEIAQLGAKIRKQEAELKDKEKKQKLFYGKYKELFITKDRLSAALQKDETKVIRLEEEIRRAEAKANAYSVDNAALKAELAGLYEEMKRYEGVSLVKGRTEEELKKEVWAMERQMEQAGNINMRALEVYDAIEKEYNSLMDKRAKLGQEKQEVLVMINEIETKKKDIFMKTFDVIDANFQKMFSGLSTKGEAFLELENPNDPLAEGLRIKVRITGKKFLDIRSLSGGEKTLTALAFLFAIQEHEPASFYVLDEVDAALDKKNSEKLSEMISSYSQNAQYIMISHNDTIISKASTIYGVSMNEHGMSKVVSLKL